MFALKVPLINHGTARFLPSSGSRKVPYDIGSMELLRSLSHHFLTLAPRSEFGSGINFGYGSEIIELLPLNKNAAANKVSSIF